MTERRWRERPRPTEGPPKTAPRRRRRLPSLQTVTHRLWHWLSLVGLLLLLIGGLVWLKRTRDRADLEFRFLQTELELKAVAALVRSHYAATGAMPEDLQAFLAQNLKKNKQYGAGQDFWGHDYLLEESAEGFRVRSSGADGRHWTGDDLVHEVAFPDPQVLR